MWHLKFVHLLVAWFALASVVSSQQTQKKLTNQDVIDMISIGLSDDLIIQKIKISEQADFDTSPAALGVLKKAKASDAVLAAMMSPHPASPLPLGSGPSQSPPGLPPELGVYHNSVDGYTIIPKVEAAKRQADHDVSWVNGRGANFEIFTYRGAHAQRKMSESRPTFYVRLIESALGMGDWEIFQFKEKKDAREVEWSATNPERKKGVLRAVKIRVSATRIAEGIYKLTPESELVPGEYILSGDFPGYGYDFAVLAKQ